MALSGVITLQTFRGSLVWVYLIQRGQILDPEGSRLTWDATSSDDFVASRCLVSYRAANDPPIAAPPVVAG